LQPAHDSSKERDYASAQAMAARVSHGLILVFRLRLLHGRPNAASQSAKVIIAKKHGQKV